MKSYSYYRQHFRGSVLDDSVVFIADLPGR